MVWHTIAVWWHNHDCSFCLQILSRWHVNVSVKVDGQFIYFSDCGPLGCDSMEYCGWKQTWRQHIPLKHSYPPTWCHSSEDHNLNNHYSRNLILFWCYFTMMSEATPYSIKWQDDRWIGKELERSGHGLNGVLPQYLPGGTEGNITVMVVSVPAKKQNEHILNTGHQDHYCYATDL